MGRLHIIDCYNKHLNKNSTCPIAIERLHIINCYNKTHNKNSIFPICICHPKFVPYSDTKKIKELSDKDMSKADQHQEMSAFY